MTLFGQMITFLLFVLVTKKYVWPPLQKALAERQAKIAEGLAAAERGHQDLALAQKAAMKQIKEAKQTAFQIIDDAQKQAVALLDAAKEQAEEEAKRLMRKAEQEIEEMVLGAKEGLRKQVADIALLGAQKILNRHVDKAANQDLLNQLADEL